MVPAAMIAAYGRMCGSLPENLAIATVTGSVRSLESRFASRYSLTYPDYRTLSARLRSLAR